MSDYIYNFAMALGTLAKQSCIYSLARIVHNYDFKNVYNYIIHHHEYIIRNVFCNHEKDNRLKV